MYGQDYAYANTRIMGTIVRVAATNEPVYVTAVGAGVCSVGLICDMQNQFHIRLDDLNLKPLRLGYVNTAGEATYLQRIPKRKDWKQGLRRENCMSSGRELFNFPMESLRDCVLSNYPLYKRAIQASMQEKSARTGKIGRTKCIAFHRNWAISGGEVLLYKDHLQVGHIVDGKYELLSQFTYLKESLEEIIR